MLSTKYVEQDDICITFSVIPSYLEMYVFFQKRFCICFTHTYTEHIGRLARMSVLDTEVDGSNPGSSMLFP